MSQVTPVQVARQAQSNRNHQGLGVKEQEGRRWKGEQSRALLIIHVALAKTA